MVRFKQVCYPAFCIQKICDRCIPFSVFMFISLGGFFCFFLCM
uniref:Uncharacterized protein n=1 Tax=Rhizophora mucronata TaxID=61149 RepID=A0A2P2NUC6_RHIMU